MKKIFVSVFAILLAICFSGNVASASSNWSISQSAPAHAGVYISSSGTLTQGPSVLTIDGWAALNLHKGAFTGGTVDGWIDGRVEVSMYTPLYETIVERFDRRHAYNKNGSSAQTVVSTDFRGKMALYGWPDSIRVYAKGYIQYNEGVYETNIYGYDRAL